MACYFRVQGEEFDVNNFLINSPWKDSANAFRKGEEKSVGKKPREYSSLSIEIGDEYDESVTQQIAACRAFIEENREEIVRLRKHSEHVTIWFSLAYYLPIGEVYAVCPYFESEFLTDLTSIGAEFEFNVFCCSVE
ncbi:DUF4279 domain-containing protein [Undibacterium sp. Dicai25W]|uniref:DUF4279 domain-containing protein n=1 Tax=Undibacterium sp. Dicai25W TaxID=3413034 RepID=UPI003BF10E75